MLSPNGQALTLNIKWLQHQQQKTKGEGGPLIELELGEEPGARLALDWVYGTAMVGATKVGAIATATATAHGAVLHSTYVASFTVPAFAGHRDHGAQ